jgi:hypothetical protein
MATYKGIQGFTIQNLSADPSNPIEGQVWYNSTSNVWKVEEATTVGAWATANNMNTARQHLAGAGIQTAALAFGGYASGPLNTAATEEYDGTNWSSVNSMNTARETLAGAGTQTAGLGFGGYDPALTGATEEYDGTSWATSPGSLNTARRNSGAAGIQNAALAFGGLDPPLTGATEEYNGSTWTSNPTGFKYGKTKFSRLWNTNSSFSFWWIYSTNYYSSNRRI